MTKLIQKLKELSADAVTSKSWVHESKDYIRGIRVGKGILAQELLDEMDAARAMGEHHII